MSKDKVKELAKRHGYKIRAVAHSQNNPNAYVKVIEPDGTEHRMIDWSHAQQWLWQKVYGRRK